MLGWRSEQPFFNFTTMKKINHDNLFSKLFFGLATVIILSPQISVSALSETEIFTADRQPKKAEIKTAVLSTEFDSKNISAGESEFPVQILVNPGGQAINAVYINFHFNQDILEATKIDFNSSFCTLFIDSSLDNTEGQARIICGKPYPGIIDEAQVATVYFHLKNSGWSGFEFATQSQVLANDGFGTDVLSALQNETVYLQ